MPHVHGYALRSRARAHWQGSRNTMLSAGLEHMMTPRSWRRAMTPGQRQRRLRRARSARRARDARAPAATARPTQAPTRMITCRRVRQVSHNQHIRNVLCTTVLNSLA